MLFIMHLEKVLRNMEKKLTNFVWIYIHSSKYSAARHEDFKDIQFEMKLEIGNFQQHTEVRWLTIGPAIKRILEQWEAITHL